MTVLNSVERSIDATPAGSRKVALARTLIAAAQLSILVFTNWDALFVPLGKGEFGPQCTGVAAVGAYCIADQALSVPVATWIVILGLVFVLSGYFPRYTGLLHVWLTYSLSGSVKLPDGGEAVGQIVVLLLAVVMLSDDRLNHWHAETPGKESRMVSLTWAACQILRLQLAWVYVNAAVSKTSVPEWTEGSAVYYIARDPMFGVAGPLAPFFESLSAHPAGVLMMTWGAIVVEATIGVLLLFGGVRQRVAAFWLAVCLHAMFIAMIGLWSFSFVMFGAVLAATGPTVRLRDVIRIGPRQKPKSESKTIDKLSAEEKLVRGEM